MNGAIEVRCPCGSLAAKTGPAADFGKCPRCYRKEYLPVGAKIVGSFSNLPFSGVVIGYILECVKVSVEFPHMNLPATGDLNTLCFHPADKNVFVVSKAAVKS